MVKDNAFIVHEGSISQNMNQSNIVYKESDDKEIRSRDQSFNFKGHSKYYLN